MGARGTHGRASRQREASEPLAAAVGYYERHRKALYRFVNDPEVPIDNSPTEREFQNVAKLRLSMLFAGRTEGAHRACVLLGIVATCRTIGVPVQAYLAWVFERVGTHRDLFDLDLAELTPAAFKSTPGARSAGAWQGACGPPASLNGHVALFVGLEEGERASTCRHGL
jgi:hypothetical protein